MANNFFANPFFIDTDTSVGGGTDWRGASGGSRYTGGIGVRPIKLIISATGATTAGNIVINEIKSDGTTGAVLFQARVPTATAAAATSQEFDIEETASGWHNFIVSGPTATGTALLGYYRV